jgi:hypothetical protein
MYILPSVKCTLCGALWDRENSMPPGCNHTEQEWSAYSDAHPEIPKDMVARWAVIPIPEEQASKYFVMNTVADKAGQ